MRWVEGSSNGVEWGTRFFLGENAVKKTLPILPVSGRSALLGSIVVLGAVLLLGCGGSDTPAPDSGAAPAAPGGEAAAPAETPAGPAPKSEAAAEPAKDTGEKPAEKAAEKPAEAAPAPAEKAEGQKPPAAAPEGKPAEEAKKAPEEKASAASQEEQESRPADVAAWKDDDYRSAKEDRDPKLLDAVAYLGENNSGDAAAARLLVELLTMPEDPEPEPKPEPKVEKKPEAKPEYDQYGGPVGMDDGYLPPPEEQMSGMEEGMVDIGAEGMIGSQGSYGQRRTEAKTPLAASYVSLTGGIVRALGANGTKEARATLEQLLLGRIPTGNDRAAVGAVLRTLIDYPNAENDALLRKVLTAPESFRPNAEKLTATLRLAFSTSLGIPLDAEKPKKKPKQPVQEESSSDLGMVGSFSSAPASSSAEPSKPKEPEKPDLDELVAAALANTVTAEDIRDTVLPLIEKAASMRLRYDLAVYLVSPNPSKELGPRLQELVTVTNPLNVQAQIGLYRYSNTPPEMRGSFERYFTTYASCALGRIFSVSTDEGADLKEPLPTGQDGTAQSPAQGWSGFGDSTKRPETRPRASEASGSEGSMVGSMEGMSDMLPPEQPADPGPPAEGTVDTGAEMQGSMGMVGSYSEGSGSGSGSGANAPAGTGKVDASSVKEFELVAAANPNLPYELAQQLWGKDLSSTLSAKMSTLAGLADGAQMLMLAGHIPTDAMRAQLLKALLAHWTDGPQAFASASVSNEVGISDPGFIAVVKSLPRRERPARTAKTEPTKEMNAQYAWMETSYGTVRVFCEQFKKAADNQKVNQTEVIDKLPFHPHSTETLTHVYAFDWQKDVGSRLAGAPVDPMRVYYLRFEETNQFNKVSGAYRRVVPSGTERPVKNGLWIDGTKAGPEPGRRTTMDVIIDRTDFKAERKISEDEPMVIQVLYVEINDPNPPAAAPKAADNAAAG